MNFCFQISKIYIVLGDFAALPVRTLNRAEWQMTDECSSRLERIWTNRSSTSEFVWRVWAKLRKAILTIDTNYQTVYWARKNLNV
jgi:hypothetical protein